MVGAVDGKAAAIERAQQHIVCPHEMDAVNAVDLAVVINVLAQCAAEGDVDELRPAADAENGLTRVEEAAIQCEFVFVPIFIHIIGAMHGLAVEPRVNVSTAGQQQGVAVRGLIAHDFRAQRGKGGDIVGK